MLNVVPRSADSLSVPTLALRGGAMLPAVSSLVSGFPERTPKASVLADAEM